MVTAEKSRTEFLREVKAMRETVMTYAELEWLREQMESQDAEIRKVAKDVHDTKLFLLSDYAGIKNTKIVRLEFYVQGVNTFKSLSSDAQEYRHARYILNANGNVIKKLFDGDAGFIPFADNHFVVTKAHTDIKNFFGLFLAKLEELFVQHIYLPGSDDPGLLYRAMNRRREVVFSESMNARWSISIDFENGAHRTAIREGCYLSDASYLLEAIDMYLEGGFTIYLEPDDTW